MPMPCHTPLRITNERNVHLSAKNIRYDTHLRHRPHYHTLVFHIGFLNSSSDNILSAKPMNQVLQRDVLHFVRGCLDFCPLLADVGVADAQSMIWTAELIFGPVGGRLQRVQPDGGGKLHLAAAAVTPFERQPARRWRIMCVIFAAFATPQVYSTLFDS